MQANICLSKMLCTGNKYSKYFLTRGRSIFLNHSTAQFCLSLTATAQAMSVMIPHIARSDNLAGRQGRGLLPNQEKFPIQCLAPN